MAFMESEKNSDIGEVSDTDNETLYRLATPLDHWEEGSNPSSDVSHSENDFPTNKNDKAKHSIWPKSVANSERTPPRKQAPIVPKMVKLQRGKRGKYQGRKNVSNNISRSGSSRFILENIGSEDQQISYDSDQYHNRRSNRVSQEDPNVPPQSGGARGNHSDRFPDEERLPGPVDQKCPRRVWFLLKQRLLNILLLHRRIIKAVVGNSTVRLVI